MVVLVISSRSGWLLELLTELTKQGANDRYRDLAGQLTRWDLTPAMGSWYPDKEEVPCDQLDSSV